MRRSPRQRAASKAALACAAKLTPEQRKYRAQRAALARYNRPAFEALKATEAARARLSEEEQKAAQIVNDALEQYPLALSNSAELALRNALSQGGIPFINSDNGVAVL
jgi:hypothetical protein